MKTLTVRHLEAILEVQQATPRASTTVCLTLKEFLGNGRQ